MDRNVSTEKGSQNSWSRSDEPRAANPSMSSSAIRTNRSPARASTARGRNGASTTFRTRSCAAPSDPSMFTPIVRFSVDGSVAPVNSSG